MGLFGLVYVGIVAACKGIVSIQNGLNNVQSREEAINKGKKTYFDHRGATRLIDTNEQVYFTTLSNGERVLKRLDGSVAYNYDIDRKKEKIKKRNDELDKQNSPVILLGAFEDVKPSYVRTGIWRRVGVKTAVYQHKQNKKLYFRQNRCRPREPHYLYIELETGMVTFLDQWTTNDDDEWIKNTNERRCNNEYFFIKYDSLDTV